MSSILIIIIGLVSLISMSLDNKRDKLTLTGTINGLYFDSGEHVMTREAFNEYSAANIQERRLIDSRIDAARNVLYPNRDKGTLNK